MDEQLLEDFLSGKIDIDHFLKAGFTKSNYKEGDFIVTRDHLIKLCDLAIEKKISEKQLENISDYIVFSEYFSWDTQTKDGKIISDTLNDWGNPTLNYPINEANLKLWKDYLATGVYKLKKTT